MMEKKNIFWDFDTVVKEFDNHISKSVPGYIECQNLVSDVSVFFINPQERKTLNSIKNSLFKLFSLFHLLFLLFLHFL